MITYGEVSGDIIKSILCKVGSEIMTIKFMMVFVSIGELKL